MRRRGLCFKRGLLQSCNTSQLTRLIVEHVCCFGLHARNMKRDSHMWIRTYTRGYLAPSQIPDPAQRAIVVSYDNELNMPASGMCENEPVSEQKCPLSHSLIDPVAPPAHDWHTNAFAPQCGASVWHVDGRAGGRKRAPWLPPKIHNGNMQRRWRSISQVPVG